MSQVSQSKYSPQLLSAIFLVAGTCIGGGMLALPVGCSQAGFIPSLFLMTMAWLAMTGTALCLVEVGFWMKKDDAHIISMSSAILGRWGKIACWLLYLFISYASLVAYVGGAGDLIAKSIHALLSISISKELGCWIFAAIFGPALFLSHKLLGRVNGYLVILMIAAFALLITCSLGDVQPELLLRHNWSASYYALPLLLTSFSFQTIVPSLHPFLDHHAPSLRVAIVGGTTIAFVVYLIWQFIVLGCVPLEGTHGLMAAVQGGEGVTYYLAKALSNPWIPTIAGFFAFFALVTSFFGFSIGLYDFLSDGLGIPKVRLGHVTLIALIVIPTLYFAITFDRIFLAALDTSGGFGDSILNGIFPILMVWIGRYWLRKSRAAFYSFGKFFLICMAIFYCTTLIVEISMHTGHMPKVTDIRSVNEELLFS